MATENIHDHPTQAEALQASVNKLQTTLDIYSKIFGAIALAALGGIVWVIVAITSLQTEVKHLTTDLAKMEARLDAFEKPDGPLGLQIRRLQDQVDAIQKAKAGTP